jgi:hypothetical protein
MATSLRLSRTEVRALASLARARGYIQSRGAGAGLFGSVSAFAAALAGGELVALGPVAVWAELVGGLEKALAEGALVLTPGERDALTGALNQVLRDADFAADATDANGG